ncbi:MAG: hypothetical protein XU10_C0014G0016 [Chloroflexi bacterium CSP1-4]|nr:MAG: hypothetical protein XU10_C0014G0016 [Chloroflexi bacterium CSP1-4]
MGDPVVLAVVAGALAEPGGEDGLDGQVELLVGVLGELAAGVGADDLAERGRGITQVARIEVGVQGGAPGVLDGVEGMVEARAVHAQHDAPEHLDKAAVGVPAEALVAGQVDEAVQRGLVEAEVEDGVHHARHRELRARAHAHEERVGRIAEALAGLALDFPHRLQDVLPEPVGKLLAGVEVVVAGFGGDGEAGRHRQAGAGHLGQAGALAAEQVAHRRVALGLAGAPGVDVALRGLVGAAVRARGLGHRGRLLGTCRAGLRRPRGRCVAAIVPGSPEGTLPAAAPSA